MKLWVKRGATSVMLRVFIQANNVTTGVGLTGLTNSSTNLNIAMLRELSATAEVYAGADIETITTIGTYAAPTASTNIRFKAVDATNMPGVYELQFHNSANQGFGSGDASRYVTLYIFEITTTSLNIAPLPSEITLVAVDIQDTVRLGLTALPNAAADAAGGLPISDAGGLDLDARLDAAVTSRLAPTTAGRTLDVTATGEAGIDWANIGAPTTAQGLTGTTIATSQVVASVSGAVGSVTGLTPSNLDTTVSSRATPAQVNAEVVDGLNVDTYAEPGQGAPAATATLAAKLNYLFKAWRNKFTQTATEYDLLADDAVTVDQKATVSDDGTTFSRGEVASGP
jgi:hypothetical protein